MKLPLYVMKFPINSFSHMSFPAIPDNINTIINTRVPSFDKFTTPRYSCLLTHLINKLFKKRQIKTDGHKSGTETIFKITGMHNIKDSSCNNHKGHRITLMVNNISEGGR